MIINLHTNLIAKFLIREKFALKIYLQILKLNANFSKIYEKKHCQPKIYKIIYNKKKIKKNHFPKSLQIRN